MAIHDDTICHFRCNKQLNPSAGSLSHPFGQEFGTREMWAVMQMTGEGAISRHRIGSPCWSHLLKYGVNVCWPHVLNFAFCMLCV